jgi:hypothetical protein
MGYIRERRYANFKSSKKHGRDHDYQQLERGTGDPRKSGSS